MCAFYKKDIIDIANFMGIFPMLAKIRIHIKMISKKNDFFHLRKTNFISMLVYFGLYFNTHTHAHDQHFPEVPSLSMVLTKFPSAMRCPSKENIFHCVSTCEYNKWKAPVRCVVGEDVKMIGFF